MTQHKSPPDIGNLYGAAFIAASQAGLDRTNRMYGNATQHLQDRLKATNFIIDHIGGVQAFESLSAREFIAMQLVTGAFGILRAEEGQELNVLATIASELAALAATYEAVAQHEAEPAKAEAPRPPVPAPTPHTPEMNKALEPRPLPPQTSRPALITENPKA